MQRLIKTMVVSPSFSARHAVSLGGFVKSEGVWEVSAVFIFVFVLLVLFVVFESVGDVVSVAVLLFAVSVSVLLVEESSSEQAAHNKGAHKAHRIKNVFGLFMG